MFVIKVAQTVDQSPLGGLQLACGKAVRVNTNLQDQEILPNKVGGPDGQRCKKELCGKRIFFVLSTSAMHSGRGGGVAAVQSSCSFICFSGMRMETTRCGE